MVIGGENWGIQTPCISHMLKLLDYQGDEKPCQKHGGFHDDDSLGFSCLVGVPT